LKCCPSCKRLYEDHDAAFCPIDGTGLQSLDDAEPPRDPEDARVGQSICGGRYELWRVVADGGMGRVYQGLDTELSAGVAIKVLHADVALDAVAVERFKREYALSSELPHDHIVEVIDFESTGDDTYALVMEYLEGEELRHYLQREKRTSAAWLIRILSQLAIGLSEPHKRKIVHRDIKPDNIFLVHTPDGPRVKLLDFGSVRDNSEGAKKLTVIGTTIGSPFYMSPEQAQGLPELDQRADVWSLAAIAYECLTGQVPFLGKTGPAILLAILGHEPAPPSTMRKSSNGGRAIPDGVDDIISDALAKDPSMRIASVAELADRFGAAYGLAGDHTKWAYTAADEISKRIARGPEQPLAGQAGSIGDAQAGSIGDAQAGSVGDGQAGSALSDSGRTIRVDMPVPAPAAGAPPEPAANEEYFGDDEFAMGVPQGPPVGLYIAIAVVAVGVLGIILYVIS
jgi:serine/threonine-protein kinase